MAPPGTSPYHYHLVAPKKKAPRGPPISGRPRTRVARKTRQGAPKEPDPGPASPVSVADTAADPGLLIVGVGGSAGSLSPLRELVAALPTDSGMAFVVVSHQAPSGRSLLPEILAKSTAMPVREIVEKTRVEPNHIYVGPRGHHVAIRRGVLSLEPDVERGHPPLPIDSFFRALARDQERCAAGIVLSGTGADGTLGLAAIREASGLSIAQDPATAEFDGMPTSAIDGHATDFVLPPAEMPERLLAYRRGLVPLAGTHEAPEVPANEMERILDVIRVRGGHDFSDYKRATLLRRIERRMHLHHIESLADYAHHLEENDDEVDVLWRDWLIGVSGFFRDPEAFRVLAEAALPRLLAAHEDGSTLRIWVPGCATGEEVYSLVILMRESLERLERHLNLQVFGTDLDPIAIQLARAGRYPAGIAADVGSQRLERFFVPEDRFYRVGAELRELVIFAVQDVLQDPPFGHVDLISCRNLLIYVEPPAQQRLLQVFHYSLNPGGLLLLGSSESVAGSEGLFSVLDGPRKLFLRNDAALATPMIRPRVPRPTGRKTASAADVPARAQPDLAGPLRRVLAERFGPPAVLVDERGKIQQIHGRVGTYLELPAGRVNVNLLEMAREGLRAPLASALGEAAKGKGAAVERNARVQSKGAWRSLHLTVKQLREPELSPRLFFVSFETAAPDPRGSDGPRPAGGRKTQRGKQLTEELRDARRDLQSSVGELQTANEALAFANEEVQSTNEELQSANEELQSTNEELQTAKEEAQSLNEELQTTNAELSQKLEAFEQANDDLLNLMNNIEIAAIFLDEKLRVKRFTPQARSVARLIDSDVGRPLADLAILIDYPDLLSDAARVLETLHASERQVPARDGRWYTVRLLVYRTARNAVEGLVLTFFDITETKRSERAQAARVLAERIVDAVREPFLVLDGELRVVRANRSYYRTFQAEPAATEGCLIQDLESHQWIIPTLRERLERVLRDGEGFDDFEVETEFPEIGPRKLVLNARPLVDWDGMAAELVLLGFEELRGPRARAPQAERGRS